MNDDFYPSDRSGISPIPWNPTYERISIRNGRNVWNPENVSNFRNDRGHYGGSGFSMKTHLKLYFLEQRRPAFNFVCSWTFFFFLVFQLWILVPEYL